MMSEKISTKSKLTATQFAQLPESLSPIELINGDVIEMPAPKQKHQYTVLNVAVFLRGYAQIHGGEVVIAPMDVYLNEDNVVQPDVFWTRPQNSLCQLGDDGWWHGAPDLVVEVLSPGTARHDRVVKLRLYEQFGVYEYWMIDPQERLIEVWGLQGAKFIGLGIYEVGDVFVSLVLNNEKISADILLGKIS
ncbi:MAG TPA: Uma2 family endonuclease [Aggregatilineales bacterium]|nr:Uma2 family endonuclease [Aggregatilineales bacterium]